MKLLQCQLTLPYKGQLSREVGTNYKENAGNNIEEYPSARDIARAYDLCFCLQYGRNGRYDFNWLNQRSNAARQSFLVWAWVPWA